MPLLFPSSFFAALFLYFVVGTLFMRFGRNAQGTDMIPNKNFWVSLPQLIKVTIDFCFEREIKTKKRMKEDDIGKAAAITGHQPEKSFESCQSTTIYNI